MRRCGAVALWSCQSLHAKAWIIWVELMKGEPKTASSFGRDLQEDLEQITQLLNF